MSPILLYMGPTTPRTGSRSLGRRIATLRGARTQKWVIEQMNLLDSETEHSRTWLSAIERGHRGITLDDAALLARILGVTLDDVYGLHAAGVPTRLERLASRYGRLLTDEQIDIIESLAAQLVQSATPAA